MFNYTITVSVDEGTPYSEVKNTLLKNRKVKKVTKAKEENILEEPLTEYFAKGKQLSVKEFKKRIATAEEDIKAGRFYTPDQMKEFQEQWRKKHGLAK